MELIKKKGELKRVKTYIEGLDETMEGGIPKNHVTLISGTAGSMKSSISFNILYNRAIELGEVGVYFSLEQSYVSLLNHFINMGFDFSKVEVIITSTNVNEMKDQLRELKESKKGAIIISDLGDIRKEVRGTKISDNEDWWNLVQNLIVNLKKEIGYSALVLDSLDALYVMSDFNEKNARSKLFYIFEFLRDLECNSFLISETPPTRIGYSKYGVEDYLADGVIMLRLVERYRKVTREISIIKMRATKCNNDLYTLEFDGTSFKALYGGKPPLV